MQLLIIEDDPSVQVVVKAALEKDDHEVFWAQNTKTANELISEYSYDMIILDLGLPDGNGYDICKRMRNNGITTPVLILSGEQSTDIKVKCLKVGADDYLTKPFDNSELTARIDSIVRRSSENEDGILHCGELEIDLMARKFYVNDANVELTNNEFNLLVYLIRNKNTIISQEDIAADVWGINFDTHTNYINVYISYLRKKIREHSENEYIETVRQKGFIMNSNHRQKVD